MAKYAVVVMSEHSEGNPGGQGRLLHALSAAQDFRDAGEEVSIWFHGWESPGWPRSTPSTTSSPATTGRC